MNKQLNLKWVSETIGNDYKEWQNGDVVFINAQTGTGKNYFIENILINHSLTEKKSILYLCNRINLKRQVKIDVAKLQGMDISEMDFDKLDELETIGNITIASYQKIQHHLLDEMYGIREFEYDRYDYVVFDEVHYIIQDSSFANKIFVIPDFLKSRNVNSVKIYMSATMDYIEKPLRDIHSENRIVTYTTGIDYSYINAFYFKKFDDIINTINNDESDNKWLLFMNNVDKAVELLDKIQDSKFICSESSKHSGKMDEEELNNIINNQKFNCKCLITTKVLDNGINIIDDKIVNVVIMALDKVDFIQMLGRKRININNAEMVNLYINARYKKSFVSKLNFTINDKYNAVELFNTDRIKFNRKYDVDLSEIEGGLFYKNREGNFMLNKVSYKMLLQQKTFYESMIKRFNELGDDAFIYEQLSWIGLEYEQEGWIDEVMSNAEIETLESVIEKYVGQKLFDEEQQLISDLIMKELIGLSKLVDYRTKKLKPSTLEKILRDELNLPYAMSKSKRENSGEMRNKRYIVISKIEN